MRRLVGGNFWVRGNNYWKFSCEWGLQSSAELLSLSSKTSSVLYHVDFSPIAIALTSTAMLLRFPRVNQFPALNQTRAAFEGVF